MAQPGDTGAPVAGGVPPTGEEVHLPGPTLVPVMTALGITLAVVGVVLNLYITVAGVIITVVAIVRWVQDTRRDIAELPLEHR